MLKKKTVYILFLAFFMFASVQPSSYLANQTERTVTLLLNTRQIYEGSSMTLAQQPHVVQNGVTYVSMRSFSDLIGGKVSYNSTTKEYFIEWNNNKIAYTVNSTVYRFNETTMTHPSGQPYLANGTLMVPLRGLVNHFSIRMTPRLSENKLILSWNTQRETGTTPVQPTLQADFSTDKLEYRIGERITYIENSVTGNARITNRTWTNNEDAFFVPGPKTITLEIQNEFGQKSSASRTIYISNEVLYTKEEYDLRYAKPGTKISVDREAVLSYDVVNFDLTEERLQLIRNNSPEKINQEGIYYQDRVSGHSRILIHQLNGRPTPANMYVIAENPNNTDLRLTLTNLGFAGPNDYVSVTGKNAVARYLEQLGKTSSIEEYVIPAGKKEMILTDFSGISIGQNQVVTLYADLHSPMPVDIKVIALDKTSDFEKTYPFLRGVTAVRDGKHTRGTFDNGNRTLRVKERVGEKKSRLIVGDGVVDTFVKGIDNMTGLEETNFGNRGVLYTIALDNVAPNTAVVLNPRGGVYSGAFLVNGKLVNALDQGIIQNPSEGTVLYRTGSRQERVSIQFIPASGSNLPLSFLFLPLNEKN